MRPMLDWHDDDHDTLRGVRRLTAFSILGVIIAAFGLGLTIWQVAQSVEQESFALEQQRAQAAIASVTARSGPLTPALVDQLGRDYVLAWPRLGPEPDPASGLLSVVVPEGQGPQGSYLSWRPLHPGLRVMQEFAPTRLPLLLLVVSAVAGLLYYLNRLAGQLHGQRQRARQVAGLDPLTGLANRLQFDRALSRTLAAHGAELGLLCLDLDRFKQVNDRLGHAAGDAVLQAVAARLARLAKPGDLVVRLGGDEFAFLCRPPLTRSDLSTLAQAIIDAVERPVALGEKTAYVGVSIGIAQAGGDCSPSALMALADSALYRAKARQDSAFAFAAAELIPSQAVAAA